jgi:hypothetical protein
MQVVNNRTLDVELSLNPTDDCVGIVVGDRDDTESNSIKVYIPRFMQGIDIEDGKTKDESASINNSKILNSKNKNIGSSSINLKNYIEVPPFMVPGINPPRYICGERVNIQFIDKDIKSPIYLPFQVHDVVLRKEDVIRIFTPSKADYPDPVVDSNSYFLELNSKEKFVRIFTSNENEEKCPFTFNINTKDGIVTFKDDTKRMFEWNYDEDKLLWTTDAGIEFEFKEQAARLVCETLDIKASESINIETSKFKLKSDKGDVIIDNMYVKNSASYEQETPNAKLKYDMAELSGNLWQIISSGLFFDAPATIHTGMSIFAGFYITKLPAPGKTPSVYSGGCLDGASPKSSSTPSQAQPNSSSPASKGSGSSTDSDMKGGGKGKPLAFAEPVIECLKEVAKQADKALGLAKYHMHPGEYKPLAMSPSSPSVDKPMSKMEKSSYSKVNSKQESIKVKNFRV